MIRITKITIRNFLSIGNVTQQVNLTLSPLTLIIGENIDFGNGINRNGAGKTSLLQAVSYGLFGEPLTKITLDNLCNSYNGKGMMVTIDFERDGKPYRIERGRKPNVLHWYTDGHAKDEAQGKSAQTQAEIDRVVGMSHRMFRHIVALNTFTTPFLREKAAEQREIIEELLGITQLSQRAEALKKLLDVTKEQVRDEEATLKANGDANARIQAAIDRAHGEVETWQSLHEIEITKLMQHAEKLSGIDIDNELTIFDQIDDWQQSKKEIDEQIEATQRQAATLDQEIARLDADLRRYQAEASASDDGTIQRLERQAELCRTEANQTIQPQINRLAAEAARHRSTAEGKRLAAEKLADVCNELQHQIDHPSEHTCPTCNQQLAGTDHALVVISELNSRLTDGVRQVEELIAEFKQCNTAAITVNAEIIQHQQSHAQQQNERRVRQDAIEQSIVDAREAWDARRRQVKEREAAVRATRDQVAGQWTILAQQKTHLEDRLLALGTPATSSFGSREAIWQFRQRRDALFAQTEAEMERGNPHQAKLDALTATLVHLDYGALNELTVKLKHEQFLHKLLTAKDSFVRKKIVDQNLSFLNKRLDYYLNKLGLPHEVRFMPDLGVEIALLGRGFDFEQLSRGEMNRLTLAACWSFRDVWQNLNTAFNLMFCDEMLDSGLDEAGVEAAWMVLQEMTDKNIFVVSHKETLMGRANRVLVVRKEAQFTNFLEAA